MTTEVIDAFERAVITDDIEIERILLPYVDIPTLYQTKEAIASSRSRRSKFEKLLEKPKMWRADKANKSTNHQSRQIYLNLLPQIHYLFLLQYAQKCIETKQTKPFRVIVNYIQPILLDREVDMLYRETLKSPKSDFRDIMLELFKDKTTSALFLIALKQNMTSSQPTPDKIVNEVLQTGYVPGRREISDLLYLLYHQPAAFSNISSKFGHLLRVPDLILIVKLILDWRLDDPSHLSWLIKAMSGKSPSLESQRILFDFMRSNLRDLHEIFKPELILALARIGAPEISEISNISLAKENARIDAAQSLLGEIIRAEDEIAFEDLFNLGGSIEDILFAGVPSDNISIVRSVLLLYGNRRECNDLDISGLLSLARSDEMKKVLISSSKQPLL